MAMKIGNLKGDLQLVVHGTGEVHNLGEVELAVTAKLGEAGKVTLTLGSEDTQDLGAAASEASQAERAARNQARLDKLVEDEAKQMARSLELNSRMRHSLN